MSRRAADRVYELHVSPDGAWTVHFGYEGRAHRVGAGRAASRVLGEMEALCAIEDDKAERAKARIRERLSISREVRV